VVYQEFANIIDRYDGRADGNPMLSSKEHYRNLGANMHQRIFLPERAKKKAKKSFLNAYNATNEPEFFAVATEYFFEKPLKLIEKNHSHYKLLAAFYNQDPAAKFPR